MAFPDGFVWGAATSAYQIEGATGQDGRGPSIWDTFARRPGAIWGGHTADLACDHYGRLDEDLELMKQIGLKAYRFSIAWPRVMPDGVGTVNEAGLGFYDRLVDGLLAAGIEPFATLFHWDLPQALGVRGGWFNRDIADWFGDYAAVVTDRLSDRVKRWVTINEPQVFIKFGYGDGVNAPGYKLGLGEQTAAGHNALRAHGRGVQAIRAHGKQRLEVGWAPVGRTDFPASGETRDIDAARLSMMSVREKHLWNNTWWADPVCLGSYPEDGLALFGADGPEVKPGDMEQIRQPIDFYGVNIYDGRRVRAADAKGGGGGGAGRIEPEVVPFAPGHAQTAFRWFITPEALRWGPRFLYERYRLPVYITENGMSNVDWPCLDGRVRDPQRIDYTTRYLRELRRSIDDGVDVRGYFHWSLLDNFEWAEGFKERFGLVHVDFATGKRTLKDSARWYKTVIQSNGAVVGE